MNWGEFFAMGGYAFYVWSAWGLCTLVLLYLFTQAKWQNAKIRREIKRQLARENISREMNQPQRSNSNPRSI